MSLTKQRDKAIGIFGLGITGISLYKSLANIAKQLICYDDSEQNKASFIASYGSKSLLSLEDNKWTKLDKIIISPGVPHSHPIFKLARSNQIPITSDIELFIEENPDSEFIFITGTNGKSTTTTLTGHILSQPGLDYHVGGNIGIPVMSLPLKRKGYIFELSSFQIELLQNIDPKIAAITNITPDHLDRYKTVEEYAHIKEKIFTSNSLKIIGVNSEISRNSYDKFKKIYSTNLIAVSTSEIMKNGVYCDNNYFHDNFFDQQNYHLPELPYLKGIHNKENIAMSYAICRALGVKGSVIIKALESFKGLAHRMQYIGKYQNIVFYNDSKATNIASALASLSAFNNIIWFAGGKFKENSFTLLEPILKNIKKAYLFGESKNLFAKFLDSKIEYEICLDLEEAFTRAVEYFKNDTNNVVFLLAPACASYDQFKNFEERGNLFIKLATIL